LKKEKKGGDEQKNYQKCPWGRKKSFVQKKAQVEKKKGLG